MFGIREVAQRFAQRRTTARARRENAIRPERRQFDLVQSLHRAQGHPTDALDQSKAQHGGHGPQLAHRQGGDALKRRNVEINIFLINPRLAVRDQRDRHLVDAWIARHRTVGELRQLAIVAAREAGPNFLQVLLHHVVVIEQPFRGRSSIHARRSFCQQSVLRLGENPTCLREACEQSCRSKRCAARDESLVARDRARPRRKVICAEQFTTKWACEQLIGRLGP